LETTALSGVGKQVKNRFAAHQPFLDHQLSNKAIHPQALAAHLQKFETPFGTPNDYAI
jgi:hypothetical protein